MTILKPVMGGVMAGVISSPFGGGRTLWDFEAGDYGPFESFTRASPGTAFSSTGLVSFASGVPRITNLGLLLEGAATNLLANSADISAAGWTPSGGTVGAVAGVDPMGAPTIKKLTETTATGAHNIRQTLTFQALAYGVSVFVKAEGRPYSILGFNSGNHSVGVDNASGALSVSSGSPTALKSILLSNGWVYASCVAVGTARNAGLDIIASLDGVYANRMYAGDGTSGIGIFCPQLEIAPAPSSPILTGAGGGSRAADAAALKVPPGCTTWEAVYGDARTVVNGSGLTPGAAFDLVAGRPWIGLGNELKRVRFSA